MTRTRFLSALVFTALLAMPFTLVARATTPDIGIKEYDDFHEVLHTLEHEAMPKKDYDNIRNQAAELVKRGYAIVKLDVPTSQQPANVEEFKRELEKFQESLKTFAKAADKGTNQQVGETFSVVHDSFETLAGMLRRKYAKPAA